jgi:minor histocompatibility antigen H13
VIASDAVLGQRTYFTRVMIAYVIGLATAFGANAITHLGQPALLYIVPATLGALVLASATRQELKQLWSFTDAPSFGLGVKPEGKAEDGKGKQ